MINGLHNCYQLRKKFLKGLIAILKLMFERHSLIFLKPSLRFGTKKSLKTYGVDGNILKLLENFLYGRQQKVVLNAPTSP